MVVEQKQARRRHLDQISLGFLSPLAKVARLGKKGRIETEGKLLCGLDCRL